MIIVPTPPTPDLQISDAKLTQLIKVPGATVEAMEGALRWVSDDEAEELVTELLRKTQKALTNEQSELVLLLRSHENLAVITFNTLGLITSVCKNCAELLGQPVENLIGQPIDAVLVARSRGIQQSALEMHKADAGETVHVVRDHLRKDGTNFEAEHTLIAVVGRGDHVVGFVREIRDVSDHRLHETHIAEFDRVIEFLTTELTARQTKVEQSS